MRARDDVSEFEWEERAQVQQLLHMHELGRATSHVLSKLDHVSI